jgi:hypothetical protein
MSDVIYTILILVAVSTLLGASVILPTTTPAAACLRCAPIHHPHGPGQSNTISG